MLDMIVFSSSGFDGLNSSVCSMSVGIVVAIGMIQISCFIGWVL